MAADFTELKKRVEFYIDDTMEDDTAIMLFNQCSEDISHIAANAKKITVPFLKDEPIMTLPEDFIEPMEIKMKWSGQSVYLRIMPIGLVQPADIYTASYPETDGSSGYELFGREIEIRSASLCDGELLYRYYAKLPKIANLSEVPLLDSRFHDMYALFAAMKYYQNYQDELAAKRDYEGEYLTKRQEMAREFEKIKVRSKSKTTYVRRWI